MNLMGHPRDGHLRDGGDESCTPYWVCCCYSFFFLKTVSRHVVLAGLEGSKLTEVYSYLLTSASAPEC